MQNRAVLFDSHLFTLSNTSLTFASDSPNHMVSISGPAVNTKYGADYTHRYTLTQPVLFFSHCFLTHQPLMDTKLAWHSLAMALARRVLPQPGGP